MISISRLSFVRCLKKIRIEDNGDSEFLPGTMVDALEFEDDATKHWIEEGKEPAEGKQVLLGITKAALAYRFLLCPLHPSRRPQRF